MRPVRLHIEGFAAFREPVEIDFTDVDLGALVGPTGSGKSSVIDAVTFALFGQVARYDNAKVVAPAIHQQSNEARILLEFELGGAVYRAARVVRRNTGARDGATTKEARLERIDEGHAVVLAGRASEMETAVTELLGLDFARFTKTVVLPQGRFAAFLHDTPGSRLDLLRDLLDIKVYDRMATTARRAADTSAGQAELLRSQLADRPDADQVTQLEAKVGAIVAARDRYDRLMVDLAEQEGVASASASLLERLRTDLGSVEAVAVPADVTRLADRLQRVADDLATAVGATAEAESRLAAATEAVATGPDLARTEQALERLRRQADLETEVEELLARQQKGQAITAEAVARAETIRAELERLDRAASTAAEEADAARAALGQAGSAEHLRLLRRRWAERTQILEASRAAASAVESADALVEQRRRESELAHAAAAAAHDRRQHLATLRGASVLIAELAVGAPCPVCRQEVMSLPDHDPDAEWAEVDNAAEVTHAAAEQARVALAEAEREAAAAAATLTANHERLAGLERELTDAPDEITIEAGLVAIETAAAQVAEADRVARSAADESKARRAAAEVVEALDAEQRATTTLAGIEAKLETRRIDLDSIRRETDGLPEREALETARADARSLLAAAEEATAVLTTARQAVSAAERARTELTEANDAADRAFGVARDAVARLGPPPAEGTILERWRTLAAWAGAQRDLIRQSLTEADLAWSEADGRVHQTRATIDELCRTVAPAQPVPDDSRAWAPVLATAETELRAAIKAIESERRRLEVLAQQADDLEGAASVDRQLAQLLGARGFEQWLTEEVLDLLVDRATERLVGLSDGQYSLVSAPGGDIRIRDHRNADEVRDAKTLSGGETFLASLALALALADASVELAVDSGPVIEALFLDEGFGTLDGDTLDTVASALEELGAAGRMVVIVTHIRELADRMPVRFEVSKGPSTSTVARREL